MKESDIMGGRDRGQRSRQEGRPASRSRAILQGHRELDAMSAKDVRFSSDARDRMLRLGRVFSITPVKVAAWAPKGRNVILDKSYGAPRITKDGVAVAKEIELEDKFENMGAGPDGPRGRLENQRSRRRRHDHRDGACRPRSWKEGLRSWSLPR